MFSVVVFPNLFAKSFEGVFNVGVHWFGNVVACGVFSVGAEAESKT